MQPYMFWVKMQCIRDYGWSCAFFIRMVLDRYDRSSAR